jgi:hypothetical protein
MNQAVPRRTFGFPSTSVTIPMSAPRHGAATRNIRQPSPNQEVFIIGNGEAG